MSRNRRTQFAFRPSDASSVGVEEFICRLTDGFTLTEDERALALEAHAQLQRRVNSAYGYDGRGRSPSLVDSSDALALYAIVRANRPQRVVETGVSDGVSSSMMLMALAANGMGKLVSIDFPLLGLPRLYGRKPGWAVPEGLRARWTLVTGRSSAHLPGQLNPALKADIFFHDSEHSYACMKKEFDLAFASVRSGGVILADDATVCNALPDAAREHGGDGTAVIMTPSGLGGARVPRGGV